MRTAAAILLPLIWTSSPAAGGCPAFTGKEWEFTGLLRRVQIPNPISARPAYLTLFQLALQPDELDRYQQFLGKEIRVKGTLEEGARGRHTTPLVVNVSSLVRLGSEEP